MTVFYNDLDLDEVGGWAPGMGTAANPSAIRDCLSWANTGAPPFQAGDTVRCTNGARAQTNPIIERVPLAQNYFDGWDGEADGAGYAHWSLHNATNDPWDFSVVDNRPRTGDVFRRMAIKQDSLSFGTLVAATILRFRTCLFQWNGTLASTTGAGANCTILFSGCTFDCRVLSLNYGGGSGNDWLFRDCFFNRCYPTRIAGDASAVYEFTRCSFTEPEAQVRALLPSAAVFTDCLFDQVLAITIPDVADITADNMNFLATRLPAVTDGATRSLWTSDGIAEGFSNASRLGPGAWYFDTIDPAISANPLQGPAPHKVVFSCNGVENIDIDWDFGDGTHSDDIEPTHTYPMPGEYDVVLTFTDPLGNVTTATVTIYVTDFDYSGRGLHVSFADICFRHATQPMEGVGTTEWGGAAWVWPCAYTGTARGMDPRNEAVSLVLDNRSGETYRIGVPEVWRDRQGSYSAAPISSRIRFPEMVSNRGEHLYLLHHENHIHLNAWKEEYRYLTGYDTAGLPADLELDERLFIEGEPQAPAEMLYNVPRFGDHAFRQVVHARRMQVEVALSHSPYRLRSVDYQVEDSDAATGPAEDWPTENQWQDEFVAVDFWVARDSVQPLLDRASGEECTGTYAFLTTGPDGVTESCMVFTAGQGLRRTIVLYTGESTWLWWMGHAVGAVNPLRVLNAAGDNVEVRIEAGTPRELVVYVAGIERGRLPIAWNGANWSMIALVQGLGQLTVYENGVLVGVIGTDAFWAQGALVVAPVGSAVAMYSIRRVQGAVSADALRYYWRTVTQDAGNGGLEPMMR